MIWNEAVETLEVAAEVQQDLVPTSTMRSFLTIKRPCAGPLSYRSLPTGHSLP